MTTYNLKNWVKFFTERGYSFEIKENVVFGDAAITCSIPTSRGELFIIMGQRNARFDKPNGAVKWYCEVGDAKLHRYLEQTLEYYR